MPIPVMKRPDAPVEPSGALFADLLESSGYPVLVLDSALRVHHANEKALGLFKAEGPARPGQDGEFGSLGEYLGETASWLCEIVAKAVDEGTSLKRKDVSIGGDAYSLSLHRGEAAWILRLRPVTRELSLEYQAKRYRAHRDILLEAMDGIEGSIVIVDAGGRIRFMNRFTRKHVGDLMRDADIASWPEAAGFYREDGVTLLDGPHRIFPRALEGKTVIDQPIVIRNEITGEAIRARASAAPVFDEKGRVVSAIGWFHRVGVFEPPLAASNVTKLDDKRE